VQGSFRWHRDLLYSFRPLPFLLAVGVLRLSLATSMSLLPYAATLRALESERRASHWAMVAAAALLLGAWAAWLLGAEVSVTAESANGVLESLSPTIALAATADGILTARFLALGQHVRKGQLLATQDCRDLTARLAGLHARRGALIAEAKAIAEQQAAAKRALEEDSRGQAAAGGEHGERAREAASAAALADQIGAREARLEAAGLLAPADAARSRADAEQRRRAAAAATLGAEAASREGRAALADRAAGASRLAGELAHLKGELAGLGAEEGAIEREIALHALRAPCDGRLAEIRPAQPGSFVARGTALATLVPDALVRVAAGFASPAGGAIRPGLRAWVHLPAGPASPAAVLAASVTAVSPMPRPGGSWEVHLELSGDGQGRFALARPGEPCRVEVELARETPGRLALRALRGLGLASSPGRQASP
jgi:multidrug resistance efflux pump